MQTKKLLTNNKTVNTVLFDSINKTGLTDEQVRELYAICNEINRVSIDNTITESDKYILLKPLFDKYESFEN